jgi:hypothetical protein
MFGRSIVYGLAALLIGSAFVGLVYLLAQSYSPLQTLGVSLRMVQIIWVGGGLIVGFWFLLGLIVRALK